MGETNWESEDVMKSNEFMSRRSSKHEKTVNERTPLLPESEKFSFKREMSLMSGVSVIVSSMIGSGIFISPTGVMRHAGSVGTGLLIWMASGILATFGAISYSEVGTMIPKSGGEYPILFEAFGPLPAFLFAWTSSMILKPASLALLAFTFAKYSLAAGFDGGCNPPDMAMKLTAITIIALVVFVNCASVRLSTRFLNIFSFGKVLSLAIVVTGGVVMLSNGHDEHFRDAFVGPVPSPREVVLSFYQGLWAFDGWNQLNYVVEELKNPAVNLPRAIWIAMLLVTGLYMLTNVSYLTAMSLQELLNSPAVGATFEQRVVGSVWIIPFAVCWSLLGSCLGNCFTSCRVSYVAAREGQFTPTLAMLDIERLTPTPAVILNGLIAIAVVIPSDFDTLMNYFCFSTWIFYFSTCAALIYLRFSQPDTHRPIKVPLIIPIIVCFAALSLVFVPLVDNPKMEYLYATLCILSGLVFYVPFIYFNLRISIIETLTIFLQKLLRISLPDHN